MTIVWVAFSGHSGIRTNICYRMKTQDIYILVVQVDIGTQTMEEKDREKRTLVSVKPVTHEKVLIRTERSPHCEK